MITHTHGAHSYTDSGMLTSGSETWDAISAIATGLGSIIAAVGIITALRQAKAARDDLRLQVEHQAWLQERASEERHLGEMIAALRDRAQVFTTLRHQYERLYRAHSTGSTGEDRLRALRDFAIAAAPALENVDAVVTAHSNIINALAGRFRVIAPHLSRSYDAIDLALLKAESAAHDVTTFVQDLRHFSADPPLPEVGPEITAVHATQVAIATVADRIAELQTTSLNMAK